MMSRHSTSPPTSSCGSQSPDSSPSHQSTDGQVTPRGHPLMLLNGSPTRLGVVIPRDPFSNSTQSASPVSMTLSPTVYSNQAALDQYRRTSSNDVGSNNPAADRFGISVCKAEKAIKVLGVAGTTLEVAGDLLACFPMLDPAGAVCGLLSKMLEAAKKVHENKLDALGLVNDSITIVQAVHQRIGSGQVEVSDEMKSGIQGLFLKLASNTDLLEEFVSRSKFKLFLYAGKMQKQIENARNETLMYIARFTIESIVSLDQLQQEAKQQREEDRLEFTRRLDEFIRNPGAARDLLENDEVPEVMVTLQREVERQFEVRYRRQITTHQPQPQPVPDVQFPIPQPYLPPPPPKAHYGSAQFPPPSRRANPALGISLEDDQVIVEDDEEEEPSPTWSDAPPQSATPRRAWHRSTSEADIEDSTGEFCKQFLSYLKSESQKSSVDLPSWVITEYEVYREERISTSHFAKVYKGRWHDKVVAIKQLDPLTDKQLFLAEVGIWSGLDNEFVLPFYGAASAVGPAPWFIVSPWKPNGRITDYLITETGKAVNKIALIHQISQGMEYLHSRDVIHGDLKGQNILIDDDGHVLLCDFGLSHIKIDITSKSSLPPPADHGGGGTLRFQPPERLRSAPLTKECDVYSFAMTVFQLYSGEIPFAILDANGVRSSILEGIRPPKLDNIPAPMWNLLTQCWAEDPHQRPKFEAISQKLEAMYKAPKTQHRSTMSIPKLLTIDTCEAEEPKTPSDQDPASFPSSPIDLLAAWQLLHTHNDEIAHSGILPIDPVLADGEPDEITLAEDEAYYIPNHVDAASASEDEISRQYRRYFNFHDYSHRLNLPQWHPTPVALGDIGYMREGRFITLENAFASNYASGPRTPLSFAGSYTVIPITESPVYPRLVSDVARDFGVRIMSSLKVKNKVTKSVRRQISVPMRPGRKAVRLIVAEGKLQSLRTYSEAKSYLAENIDSILNEAAMDGHGQLQKTEIVMVVGALTASNYAMAISDYAPGTTLRFNVTTPMRRHSTEPWGFWTIARDRRSVETLSMSTPPRTSSSLSGRPSMVIPPSPPPLSVLDRRLPGVDDRPLQYAVKTSRPDGPKNAVHLSVLRFPPGGGEPTFFRDLD